MVRPGPYREWASPSASLAPPTPPASRVIRLALFMRSHRFCMGVIQKADRADAIRAGYKRGHVVRLVVVERLQRVVQGVALHRHAPGGPDDASQLTCRDLLPMLAASGAGDAFIH